MKKLIICVLLIFVWMLPTTSYSQENYGAALRAMKETQARGLIILTSHSCAPCHKLKREVIEPLLPFLKKWYVIYYINVDDEPAVAEAFKKARLWDGFLPAYYITGPGGSPILKRGSGYQTKDEWIKWHNSAYGK